MKVVLVFCLWGVASATCMCGGAKPCQHTSGQACLPLQKSNSWQNTEAGTSAVCPPETTHCNCECDGATPCRSTDTCVAKTTMFGTEVCPYSTTRCKWYPAEPVSETPAPTPAPHHESETVCKCAGDRPCIHTDGSTCAAAGVSGECPADFTRCTCGCSDKKEPCQHNTLKLCLPSYEFLGSTQCPSNSIMCEHYKNPAPGAKVDKCVCGGGKPCQMGDTCFAQQVAHDGALVCPVGTTKCSCTCGRSFVNADGQQNSVHPCQHHDASSLENFCFSTMLENGVQVCPKSTLHCQISPDSPVENLLPVPETSAPTKAPTASHNAPPVNAPKIDCSYTWGEWGTCSLDCGAGKQTREPIVATFPANGGVACPAPELRDCNLRPCEPVDCHINGWSDWTQCSVNCDDGKTLGFQTQKPIIVQHPKDGGIACPATKARSCNTQNCHAKQPECECDPFAVSDAESEVISECDVTSYGTQVLRVRHNVKSTAAFHLCKYNKVSEQCRCCHCRSLTCHADTWSAWGSCLADPETSVKYRHRSRTLEGHVMCSGDTCPDGGACPTVTQTQMCAEE